MFRSCFGVATSLVALILFSRLQICLSSQAVAGCGLWGDSGDLVGWHSISIPSFAIINISEHRGVYQWTTEWFLESGWFLPCNISVEYFISSQNTVTITYSSQGSYGWSPVFFANPTENSYNSPIPFSLQCAFGATPYFEFNDTSLYSLLFCTNVWLASLAMAFASSILLLILVVERLWLVVNGSSNEQPIQFRINTSEKLFLCSLVCSFMLFLSQQSPECNEHKQTTALPRLSVDFAFS